MKKAVILTGILLVLIFPLLAQDPPDTLWAKTFGGYGFDEAHSVYQTTDGGFIVAGITESFGAGYYDFWLIRTDASGDTLWTKTFGGTGYDDASAVQQTSDGGFVVLGSTGSYGAGSYDFWLIKTDANGNEEWNQTFGGSSDEWAYSVQQTADDGFIIAGSTESYGAGSYDFWLIKTDANGNEVWNHTFGYEDYDSANSVQQTSDGGYIVTGSTFNYAVQASDILLIKTDASGNEEWSQTFGDDDEYHNWGHSVQQTSDGGYIIGAATEQYYLGELDFWIIKTDASGNEQWNQIFGGEDSDLLSSIKQTVDGGYIVVGSTSSFGAGEDDLWLVKTDASGSEEWDQTYGGIGDDYGRSVQQTSDGGLIVAGSTKSAGAGDRDFWLVRLESIVDVEDNNTIQLHDILHQNYPNPFNPETTISFTLTAEGAKSAKIEIYNFKGQKVKEFLILTPSPSHTISVTWDGRDASGNSVASGIYFYQLKAGGYEKVKKMVLLK